MTQTPALKQITLIGVGLIGGSFVLDLKRQGLVEKVVGIDLDADNLARALERKVIDEAFEEINAQSVGGADWVLIATPVATLPHICRQLAPLLSAHTIVSDVGSTKQSALAAFAEHLGTHLPRCVAAHPIAGSDRHGALAAQFGLYQDKKLIICPHAQQDAGALETVETLWQAVGAHTYRMSAATHDAIFAAVSHMPHMLAYAYVHQIAEHPDGQTYLDFAASGFRDFTRIAASDPTMWRDVFVANKEAVLEILGRFTEELFALQRAVRLGDGDLLFDYFTRTRAIRRGIIEAGQDTAADRKSVV